MEGRVALEDDVTDILKKARHGRGLSLEEVAGHAGVPSAVLEQLERGARLPSPSQLDGLARALGLRAAPLAAIAERQWEPRAQPPLVGVETIRGDIGGYAVKGYVLYDGDSREAVLVDTGYNPALVLATLRRLDLRLVGVALTHGHFDHGGGLDQILAQWPVPVYIGGDDLGLLPWRPTARLEALSEDDDRRTLPVGRLSVTCLATPGHTPGGFCYRTRIDGQDICFVGDTLFAGSIGRANPKALFRRHLESARSLLALPSATRLMPGHGPNTTVGEEVRYNVFVGEG